MLRLIRAGTPLLFALLAAGCQSMQKPAWLPPDAKWASANGYPVAYVERGAGPTIVLVHGALNDYRTWAPQMQELAKRYRVVAISLRSYYPEPWKGEGEFSLALHGKDVAAFIEGLGAGPVHLVGWSRGGAVAVETVVARPDLVRKLILMDAALFNLVSTPGAGEDARIKRAKATEPYFRRGDMEGGLRYFFDDINGQGAWAKLPEAQRQLRRDNAWTIVGQIGDVERVGCADLGKLRMPVLLMEGENSPPLFKRMRGEAQKCVPSARYVLLPKANHQMHQSATQAFNAELAKFLAE